jgi:hypothetical protein
MPITRDTKKAVPFVKGTITSSSPLKCSVRPDSSATILKQLQSAWVFLLEQSPGDLHVNLRLQMPDGALKSALLGKFQESKLIHILPDLQRNVQTGSEVMPAQELADLTLIQNSTTLEMVGVNEQSLVQFPLSNSEKVLAGKILNEIKNAGQVKFLRSLNATAPSFNLTMDIIPVELDNRYNETRRMQVADFTDAGGTYVCRKALK